MKIIILTGRFGMGHLAAAQAIQQQIENSDLNAEIEIIDLIKYAAPRNADKLYGFFTFLVNKGSRLYNRRYLMLENRETNQKPELQSYFVWRFSKLMADKKPDLIISTLPVCSQIVSTYIEKTGCEIPLITCVTDITGHSEWISKNTCVYMVGSPSVEKLFMEKGVKPEQIFITGIPVRSEFRNKASASTATISNPVKNILVMGGGLGILPEDFEFYDGLLQIPDSKVTVITGNNLRLYKKLSLQYKQMNILGFVNNVHDYLKWADVIISKPGGITIFEAIQAGVPILALNPYLQQEIYNAEFIRDMQIGSVIKGNYRQCLQQTYEELEYNRLQFYRNRILSLQEQLNSVDIKRIVDYTFRLNTSRADTKIYSVFNMGTEGRLYK